MNMQSYFMGVATAGFLMAGIFFLRFWTKTRDQLFGAFAAAFFLLAVERAVLFFTYGDQPHSAFYLLRLAAFLIIGYAIVRKNREA